MNIKLVENQSFYLGEEIKVTVKAIYRKGDGQRYVQFCVQAPKNMLVYRDEKIALNTQMVNDDFKEFDDLPDNIGNRGISPYKEFSAKGEAVNDE